MTKLLIVEDDRVDQMAFRRMALEEGFAYDFEIAGSLAEARQMFAAGAFDVVVTDYSLGDGTAEDILEMAAGLPVIVVTASGNEKIAATMLKSGASDYLMKDEELNYLKLLPHSVETVLKLKRAEKAVKNHYATLEIEVASRTSQLQDALSLAQTANRLKDAFVANMSHEIRTPLNAIMGFAQLLALDPLLTPGQAEYVRTISRSGAHLLRLINKVLDMSKIAAGRTTLNEAVFCLHDLLAELSVMFCSLAEAKGLTLLVEQDESVPRAVSADQDKLKQILVNLMGNAVKFTETGGVAVRVRTEAVEGTAVEGEKALRLVVEVEDTGPGIPDGDMGGLFVAFQQAEAGKKAGGIGLGLAISRGFVEMMGGRLTVTSRVGKGSCFRFDALLAAAGDVAEGIKDEAADTPIVHLKKTEALAPESLAALPADLVEAMQQAIAEGDIAHLTALIAQVEKIDPDVAGYLLALADQYDYEKL